MKIENLLKVFGSASHLKVLDYLRKLPKGTRLTVREINQATRVSYPTLIKVLNDFMSVKIITVMGRTKGKVIIVNQNQREKIIRKFIKEFERM